MSFRIVWYGRFGKETSQLIEELARARIIADALASRTKLSVYIIDESTKDIVYLTALRPKVATLLRRGADKEGSSSPS